MTALIVVLPLIVVVEISLQLHQSWTADFDWELRSRLAWLQLDCWDTVQWLGYMFAGMLTIFRTGNSRTGTRYGIYCC
jgi:hypothetical protein